MSKINIKVLTEDNYASLKENLVSFADSLKSNDENSWMQQNLTNPIFREKKIKIEDFSLLTNEGSLDKKADFENGKTLYESLHELPGYILSDPRFWLWLQLEKCNKESKEFIPITDAHMVSRCWLYREGGVRRCLMMWGALSRIYYRVALTVNPGADDPYELTKWAFENN